MADLAAGKVALPELLAIANTTKQAKQNRDYVEVQVCEHFIGVC